MRRGVLKINTRRFTFVNNDKIATCLDIDLESEYIAHKISNTPLPYSLILMHQIERELSVKEEAFAQTLKNLNEHFEREFPHRKKDIPLSVAFYFAYQLGHERFAKRTDLTIDMMECIALSVRSENASAWRGLRRRLVFNERLPAKLFNILIEEEAYSWLSSIALSQLLPLTSRRALLSHPNTYVRIDAVRGWDDEIDPKDLKAILANDSILVRGTLATKNLTEEWQMRLANDENATVRGMLALSNYLKPKIAELLSRDEDLSVRGDLAYRAELSNEILKTLAQDKELQIYLNSDDHKRECNSQLRQLWNSDLGL